MKIAIQTNDFDVSAELAQLRIKHRDVGALASFVGTVREVTTGVNDVEVTQMELEHYPGMTEKSLTTIAQQAIERWKLNDAVIIHRVGVLQVTEQIVRKCQMAGPVCQPAGLITQRQNDRGRQRKTGNVLGFYLVNFNRNHLVSLQQYL